MNLKVFRIVVLLFLMTNICLVAQSRSEANTNIKIDLRSGLVINQVNGNLDFGEVISTSSSRTLTINPEFGVLFEVNGEARRRITVNYSSNVLLDNSSWLNSNNGNSDDITFTSNVRHTRGRNTYRFSRRLRNGRTIRLRRVDGIGKLFIWVGGKLEVKANQEVGDYEGTFNITVAY